MAGSLLQALSALREWRSERNLMCVDLSDKLDACQAMMDAVHNDDNGEDLVDLACRELTNLNERHDQLVSILDAFASGQTLLCDPVAPTTSMHHIDSIFSSISAERIDNIASMSRCVSKGGSRIIPPTV